MTHVRETSIAAYHDLRDTGELSRMQQQIVSVMRPGRDYSLRELVAYAGLEINTVSGRVNELKRLDRLVECEQRPCSISGRRITPVRLA